VGSCFAARQYRYHYWRRINVAGGAAAAFVMLNPGTVYTNAALKSNPTLSNCYEIAKSSGCSWLRVVNLSPLIEHPPDECPRHQPTPTVDEKHRAHIESALSDADILIAAWGAPVGDYVDHIRIWMLEVWAGRFLCLGHTKDGAPKHPLYVSPKTPLISL